MDYIQDFHLYMDKLIEKLSEAYKDEHYQWFFYGPYKDLNFLINELKTDKDLIGFVCIDTETDEILGFYSVHYDKKLKIGNNSRTISFDQGILYFISTLRFYYYLFNDLDCEILTYSVAEKNEKVLKMMRKLNQKTGASELGVSYKDLENNFGNTSDCIEFELRNRDFKLKDPANKEFSIFKNNFATNKLNIL